MADWVQIAKKSLAGSNLEQDKKTDDARMSDGTKVSGFVTAAQNKPPRVCSNCIWMGFGSCGNPNVVADKKLPHNDEGRVPVDPDDCSNSFQSQGNVLLWIVRHGVTTPDELGVHGGWIDDPLNETGKQQADKAMNYLEGKDIKHVVSSDMSRAKETAKIIRPDHKRYVDPELRPWDVGKFSGKDHTEYKDEFESYIRHPLAQIPDGESMVEFATRMHGVLLKYVEFARKNGPTLLVMHSRNFTQFKKSIEDKNELEKPNDYDKVKEGGIMAVLDEDGLIKAEIVYNRGDEKDINRDNFS